MPVTHSIQTILRPGVQSISVQYQVSGSGIWITWSEGERIIQGATVRFTVTTYSNFTLTDWDAWYSDEYDDTVSLSLSPITGQSAWEFTMPSADVYIRCEAESHSGSTVIWPQFQETGSANVIASATIEDCYNKLVEIYDRQDRINITYEELMETIRTNTASGYENFYSWINDSTRWKSLEFRLIDQEEYFQVWVRASENPNIIPYQYIETFIYSYEAIITNIDGQLRFQSYGRRDNYKWIGYTSRYSGQAMISCSLTEESTPTPAESSIRYIMSPENSGEVDADAPSEFEQGTTEFTFKWRIKAAYEFKRLTPFAVGEGSLEDDISYSLDSYDGDTRTYTFTVSQIPDWAIGVRVLIETILIPDSQNASGTNASDGPIGGDGTFDDTSDDVPLPAIPAGVSAADSGFVTLFRPTIQQVKGLGNYLWSNLDEFWENLQKIFTNPMDYIIGLNTFPVNPPVDADRAIYIGNWLTNITMPPVRNQFYEFNCGTVNIHEYFGSFLDYASNTSARIMLPFIGDRDLNVNEIMNKTLHLWYRINLLSGECLAVLTIDNNVYYQWDGNCAIPIPVTGSDWSRLYGGIGRLAGAGVGLAVGGLIGMGISSAMGAMATAGSDTTYVPFTGVDSRTHYRRVGSHTPYDRASSLAPDPIKEPPREEFGLSVPAKAAIAAGTAHIVGNNIMGAAPRVAHSGGMAGGIGIMGNRTPFIVLEYPNVNLPVNYKHLYGYPSNQYAVLGNLSGYTECKAVMFESTTATDDEVELIIRTLKSGVYL